MIYLEGGLEKLNIQSINVIHIDALYIICFLSMDFTNQLFGEK